jgi:hypothetical protein
MTIDAPQSGLIRHQVFFWLKSPGSVGDREALIKGLQTLAAIPVMRELHIGIPADTEARDVVDGSFSVSELMVFDTVADQKAYQDHPLHLAFVEGCSHLWERVIVYDSVEI